MVRKLWGLLIPIAVVALGGGPARCQGAAAESVDDVSGDSDVLRQLAGYNLTPDQLKAMAPILRGLDEKRQAVETYKRSEQALAPLRAIREALLKGKMTTDLEAAAQPVWDKLDQLESAFEESVSQSAQAVVKLLTDQQLSVLAEGGDTAAAETDSVLADVETAREFDAAAFAKWRDEQAQQLAKRATAQGPEKVAQLEKGLKDFFDKSRKLSADDFAAQADKLFQELQLLLASGKPALTRQKMEEQAAGELEFIVRSPRTVGLLEARIKAGG